MPSSTWGRAAWTTLIAGEAGARPAYWSRAGVVAGDELGGRWRGRSAGAGRVWREGIEEIRVSRSYCGRRGVKPGCGRALGRAGVRKAGRAKTTSAVAAGGRGAGHGRRGARRAVAVLWRCGRSGSASRRKLFDQPVADDADAGHVTAVPGQHQPDLAAEHGLVAGQAARSPGGGCRPGTAGSPGRGRPPPRWPARRCCCSGNVRRCAGPPARTASTSPAAGRGRARSPPMARLPDVHSSGFFGAVYTVGPAPAQATHHQVAAYRPGQARTAMSASRHQVEGLAAGDDPMASPGNGSADRASWRAR